MPQEHDTSQDVMCFPLSTNFIFKYYSHAFSGWHSIFGKFRPVLRFPQASFITPNKCLIGTSKFHKAQKQSTSLNEWWNLTEHSDLHDRRTVATHQPHHPTQYSTLTEGEWAILKWMAMKGQNPKIKVHEHRDTTALVFCFKVISQLDAGKPRNSPNS